MKKLKLDYRKVKDKHNQSGQNRSKWKFFDAMDAVLGHRPTTRPSVVLDTSEHPDEDELGESDDEQHAEQTNLAMSTEGDTQPSCAPSPSSSSSTQPSPSTVPKSSIKRNKRKRTKDEKIEAIMTSVVKEVVNSQKESDRMFLELED